MEDINQAIQAITDPSSSSSALERSPSGEEDPAAMTIDFLRARLLSERSVSKAARERAQQLAKKVSELEERLEAEIQLRKKLEADRLEILLKYRAELSEEYGDFFASSVGEGFPRDESVPDSPNSRKHDISEGFESYTPNQDEEGLPNSRLEQLERSDSSQQLSREEANDEDDETDHSGREKGVLSWGRQKGSRKEFGYGTDWPGRSLSQRSLTSTDGESPQKKWAGKSVRQIKKRENRSYDTNERGNGRQQSLAREESNGKSDTRVPLPCDDERDTEVERVLEQQAELIEQYEAEENAQRAWEAKFKKGKALSGFENDIMPSHSGVKLPSMTSTLSDEKELLVKDDAAAIGDTLPNQSLNESTTRHSSKVHPDEEPKELEGSQEQLESIHKNTLEDIDGPSAAFEDDTAGLSGDQSTVSISDEEPFRHITSTEGTRTHHALNENVTHGQMPSNMDPEQQSEQSIESSVEGRKSKYKPHLSSSFRFTVFPDVEPVAGSSPQMHGFTTYKHDAHGGGEVNESREASKQLSASGISDAHSHDSHDGASVVNHMGANDTPTMGDRPISSEDDESGESGKDMVQEETLGREDLPSHSMGVVMSSNPPKSLITSSHSFKEEIDREMKGLGGNQDPQSDPQFSDSPSYMEPRGPSRGVLQRHYPDFPSHPDHGFQPSKDFDRANFDNLALYPSIRSGIYGSGLRSSPYEETALRSQRRSLDAFDRVADVLKALEIAKLQVQTSSEQDDPFVGNTMDYDGRDRDAYYAEPPRLPSMYAAPPQPYASSVPYSSRGPATPPYMHGWGGYGASSSRQVVNAPYMHYPPYPPRIPETQNMWHPPPPPPPPPPSHGIHNSTLYHFDTRQHR